MKAFYKERVDDALRHISALGSVEVISLFLISCIFMKDTKISILLISGFILLMIIGSGLRLIFFRDRPKKSHYTNIIEKIKASSFPSMHSARIAYVGFYLTATSQSIYFSSFIILLILIVAFARFYRERHYLSDVIAGLILGAMTLMFTTIFM